MRNKSLTGYSEQVSINEGISSTYNCANCCPDSYYDSWVTPGNATGFIGDTTQFTLMMQTENCYGTLQSPFAINSGVSWNSSDPSVATCDQNGLATGVGMGQTGINASYPTEGWTHSNGSCQPLFAIALGWAACQIQQSPQITSMFPSFAAPGTMFDVIITGSGFTTNSTVESNVINSPISISGVTYQSPTSIRATFTTDANAFAGIVPIVVKNSGNSSNSKSFGIRIPHHLRVVNDQIFVIGSCPIGTPALRNLTLEVVDSNNFPVGPVNIRENYTSITTNTCGNGQPQATACAVTDNGTAQFVDTITVNCNSVNGSCGYNITHVWQWCPLNGTPVNLGTLTDIVHADQITVNGNTTGISANTYIFP